MRFMKRTILLVMTLVFMSFILLGCQSEDSNVLHLDGEIIKVSISKSEGFAKLNSDYFAVFTHEETLKTFRSVISSSIKEEGIVDMVEPEFDLEVIYENGNKQGFHIWVGKKGQISTLMKIDDTHTVYTVSGEMTNKLIALIQ